MRDGPGMAPTHPLAPKRLVVVVECVHVHVPIEGAGGEAFAVGAELEVADGLGAVCPGGVDLYG